MRVLGMLEFLLAVPDIGRRFRQVVRADFVAGFAALVRSIIAGQKGKIETIVRGKSYGQGTE